jgi:hypothetical protein
MLMATLDCRSVKRRKTYNPHTVPINADGK